jgi:hypothetical protein
MEHFEFNEEFVILCRNTGSGKDFIEFGMQGEKLIIFNMMLMAMQKNIQFANLVTQVSKEYEKLNLPNLN